MGEAVLSEKDAALPGVPGWEVVDIDCCFLLFFFLTLGSSKRMKVSNEAADSSNRC